VTQRAQELNVFDKDCTEPTFRVVTSDSEWVFQRQGAQLILTGVGLKLTSAVARKYLTLPVQP